MSRWVWRRILVPDGAWELTVPQRSWWARGALIGAATSTGFALAIAGVGGLYFGLFSGLLLWAVLSLVFLLPGVTLGLLAGLVVQLGARRGGSLVRWVYGASVGVTVLPWLFLGVAGSGGWREAVVLCGAAVAVLGPIVAAATRAVLAFEVAEAARDQETAAGRLDPRRLRPPE